MLREFDEKQTCPVRGEETEWLVQFLRILPSESWSSRGNFTGRPSGCMLQPVPDTWHAHALPSRLPGRNTAYLSRGSLPRIRRGIGRWQQSAHSRNRAEQECWRPAVSIRERICQAMRVRS